MKRTGSLMMVMAVASTAFILACSSGGDGGGGGGGGPTSPGFTFNTSGGQGGADGGYGGSGGYFDITMNYGSMGPLEVLATGTADAGFSTSSITANLGDNPLVITADTTLEILDPGTPGDEPAGGTAYLRVGIPVVFIWEAGGTWATQLDSSGTALAPVTGISVASGATLTSQLNFATYAAIVLTNDIDNQGAMTAVDVSATQRGSVVLYMASYIGSGTVDTSGSLDGQVGGYIALYPNYSFFNSGTFNSAGANSATTNAGNGGNVYLGANYKFENTGTITTSGGAATGSAGNGGSAGYINLRAYYAMNNAGNLTARGGAGIDAGGNGYEIYFEVADAGDLRNSGDLDTTGGSATGGNAGSGGDIYVNVYGGDIINSGDVTTRGGSTTDTASNGGGGGVLYLYVDYGGHYENTPAGDILFSGNVDTSGGDAVTGATGSGSGGSGGYFQIEADYDNYPQGQRVALLGYAGPITTSGGDGNYGGDAGNVQLYCDYGYTDTGYDTPGCNITNDVGFISRGGNVAAGATATPANGGDGANVYFETDYNYGMFDPELDRVVNSGAIDVSGGDSLASTTMSSGGAGQVWIWGYNGVTNSGAITAMGGDDVDTNGGTDGFGNYGGELGLYSELGTVENSGNLTGDGGDGEYRGGDAYGIELFGAAIVNSGTLAANGGDADAALSGSVGGDGDRIELFAPNGPSGVTNSGSATNAGGSGETAGDDGDYIVGGQLM